MCGLLCECWKSWSWVVRARVSQWPSKYQTKSNLRSGRAECAISRSRSLVMLYTSALLVILPQSGTVDTRGMRSESCSRVNAFTCQNWLEAGLVRSCSSCCQHAYLMKMDSKRVQASTLNLSRLLSCSDHYKVDSKWTLNFNNTYFSTFGF